MNKTRKLLIAGTVALLSLIGLNAYASGTTELGTPNYVNAGGGVVFVRFKAPYAYASAANNPDGCPNVGNFILREANPNYKDIYAAILTGRAAELPIRFFVNGCFGPGTPQFPEINSITIF